MEIKYQHFLFVLIIKNLIIKKSILSIRAVNMCIHFISFILFYQLSLNINKLLTIIKIYSIENQLYDIILTDCEFLYLWKTFVI